MAPYQKKNGRKPFNSEVGEKLARFFKESLLDLTDMGLLGDKVTEEMSDWTIIKTSIVFDLGNNRELLIEFFPDRSTKLYIRGNVAECKLGTQQVITNLLGQLVALEIEVLKQKISGCQSKTQESLAELDVIAGASEVLTKTASAHSVDVTQATTREMLKLTPRSGENNPYVFLRENQQRLKPRESPTVEAIKSVFNAYPLTCLALKYLSCDLSIDWQTINVGCGDGAGTACFVFKPGIVLFFEDPTVGFGQGRQVALLQEERVREEEVNNLLRQVLINIICIYTIVMQERKQRAEDRLAKEQSLIKTYQTRVSWVK